MNRREFAEHFGIPLRTVEDWEAGRRKMPEYLLRLMSYKIHTDMLVKKVVSESNESASKNVSIISDAEGQKIVVINDIRFKSRRKLDWNEVENCLKEYIGECFEIMETSEKIYIGSDFPDEFSHSKDSKSLKGANEKAKANIVSAIEELVEIADNKAEFLDYNQKHKNKAKYGWYRYTTRFAIPVYDEDGNLERYNVFSARMLVRCDADGKLYLYDFIRTKKETSRPLGS